MKKQELKRLRELCAPDASPLSDAKPIVLTLLDYIAALENIIKEDADLSCKTCVHELEHFNQCKDCSDYVEDHWEFGKGPIVCYYNSL